jgi:EmrB/QacA subfamily drug resistance transporter
VSVHRRGILAVVILGGFVTSLDAFIVNVAIPTISRELHTSFAAIELVIAGYVLSYAVLLVTGGRIGDRITPRRAFMWGLAIFTLSSLACGLAPTIAWLIAARVAQGIGAALLYPQVFAIVQISFSGAERTRAFGIVSGTNGLAAVLGQVLGGLLIKLDLLGSSWRLLFLINVPIGVVGFVVAARLLPRSKGAGDGAAIDVAGVVLLTLALLLLVAPLVEGEQEGWPPWIVACLVAAIPAFGVFALQQRHLRRRGRDPLVDGSLFRAPSFVLGIVTALILFAQAGALFFVLSLTLQSGYGFSPIRAAAFFVPLGCAYAVATVVVSHLLDRVGPRILTCGYAAGLVATAGAAVVAYRYSADIDIWVLVPLLAVATAANGFGTAPLFGATLADVERAQTGLASGAIATATRLGQVLGIVGVGLVFRLALGSEHSQEGYLRAFAFAACVNALLLLGATALSLRLSPSHSFDESFSPERAAS